MPSPSSDLSKEERAAQRDRTIFHTIAWLLIGLMVGALVYDWLKH